MRPTDAYHNREGVRFIDVRESYEFEAGHIAGSVNVPLMSLPDHVEDLDKDATWVVVCQIGQRSDLAARFLRVRGYNAHNLDGGVSAWTRNQLPLLKDEDISGKVVDGHAKVLEWLPEPGVTGES